MTACDTSALLPRGIFGELQFRPCPAILATRCFVELLHEADSVFVEGDEIRIRPHQHRRPDDRAAACGVEESPLCPRVRGQGIAGSRSKAPCPRALPEGLTRWRHAD